MTFYLPDGTTELRQYDPDLLSFEHEGYQIRDPMQSECSRFHIDPRKYGFEEYHTGGGCMALIKDLPSGEYLLLTDENGDDIPAIGDQEALLGRYTTEGEPVALITVGNILFDSEEEDDDPVETS
jgi:hypothetical protein